MSQVEIGGIGSDLAALVERVEAGEDVTLAREGRAVARIVAVENRENVAPARGQRQLGLLAGKWKVPDDFDAPLPDDVLASFYDGPIFPGAVPPSDEKP